ncbi:unnamed protein product [Closterium sp. NIES-53]
MHLLPEVDLRSEGVDRVEGAARPDLRCRNIDAGEGAWVRTKILEEDFRRRQLRGGDDSSSGYGMQGSRRGRGRSFGGAGRGAKKDDDSNDQQGGTGWGRGAKSGRGGKSESSPGWRRAEEPEKRREHGCRFVRQQPEEQRQCTAARLQHRSPSPAQREFRLGRSCSASASDRGGVFSSASLGAVCRARGIRQTFMLPASPQQNEIAERRIGMVMDVACTSMIHAAAPHFLWLFAVHYAAHQLNL